MEEITVTEELNSVENELDEALMSEENVVEEAPPENIDVHHCQKIIEAVLFAAGYPVPYAKLASVLEISKGAVKRIVREYAEVYNKDDDDIPRGIMLETNLTALSCSCRVVILVKASFIIELVTGMKSFWNLTSSMLRLNLLDRGTILPSLSYVTASRLLI